jgi:hypothetical protein
VTIRPMTVDLGLDTAESLRMILSLTGLLRRRYAFKAELRIDNLKQRLGMDVSLQTSGDE